MSDDAGDGFASLDSDAADSFGKLQTENEALKLEVERLRKGARKDQLLVDSTPSTGYGRLQSVRFGPEGSDGDGDIVKKLVKEKEDLEGKVMRLEQEKISLGSQEQAIVGRLDSRPSLTKEISEQPDHVQKLVSEIAKKKDVEAVENQAQFEQAKRWLKMQLEIKEMRLAKARDEVVSLHQQLATAEEEKQQLTNSVEELQSCFEEVRDMYDQEREMAETLRAELEHVRGSGGGLFRENSEKLRKMSTGSKQDLLNELTSATNAAENTDEVSEDGDFQNLRTENEQLRKQAEESRAYEQQLRAEIQQRKLEFDELREKLENSGSATAEERRTSVFSRPPKARPEMPEDGGDEDAELSESVDVKAIERRIKETFQEKLRELETLCATLSEENRVANEAAAQIETERFDFRIKAEEAEANVEAEREKAAALKEQLARATTDLEETKAKLEIRIQELMDGSDAQTKAKEDMSKAQTSWDETKRQLEEQVARLKSEAEDLRASFATLQAATDLEARARDLQSSTQDDQEKLRRKAEELQEKIIAAEGREQELNRACDDLRAQLAERTETSAQLSTAMMELSKLQEQVDSREDDRTKLKNDLAESLKQRSALARQLDDVRKDRNILQKEMSASTVAEQAMQRELSLLRGEMFQGSAKKIAYVGSPKQLADPVANANTRLLLAKLVRQGFNVSVGKNNEELADGTGVKVADIAQADAAAFDAVIAAPGDTGAEQEAAKFAKKAEMFYLVNSKDGNNDSSEWLTKMGGSKEKTIDLANMKVDSIADNMKTTINNKAVGFKKQVEVIDETETVASADSAAGKWKAALGRPRNSRTLGDVTVKPMKSDGDSDPEDANTVEPRKSGMDRDKSSRAEKARASQSPGRLAKGAVADLRAQALQLREARAKFRANKEGKKLLTEMSAVNAFAAAGQHKEQDGKEDKKKKEKVNPFLAGKAAREALAAPEKKP